MTKRQRAAYPVDSAAFLLFHPKDFPDAPLEVPEAALADGLVIGLKLGADGWRAVEVLIGEELTSEDRADIDGPPWVFRLDVRNGAVVAGDRLESRGGDRVRIPSGKYRVDWFKLRYDAIQRRRANWLLSLTPVASFDGIGVWLDPRNGVLPDEDMPAEQRAPRLVSLSDLTEAEANVRRTLKLVKRTAPDPFRAVVEGSKRFALDGAELLVEAPGEEPVTCAVPPDERHRAAVMLRRFAPWWWPPSTESGAVRIFIATGDGQLERTSMHADARAAYELMNAFAEMLARRARTLAAFEALARSGLPEDVELRATTHPADWREKETTIEAMAGAYDRNALSAILVENEIWRASTELVPAPAVSVELIVPALGELHYPLKFWGKDEPSSPVAAVRDFLART